MPKRTAADFADEATVDDPYEYTIKGRKTPCRPKAIKHFTPEQRERLNIAQMRYGKMIVDQDVEGLMNCPLAEKPLHMSLQMRFGKDYEAFWAEAQEWSEASLTKLLNEIDKHYDPTLSDEPDADDPESEAGKGRLSSVG